MRRILVVMVAACSGPATPAPAPIGVTRSAPAVVTREAVDVISMLANEPAETGTIVVGPAQLVLGGALLEPREIDAVRDVDVLEVRGSDVRVGVRRNGIRFAAWTARSQLLGVLTRRHSVGDAVHIEAGARVRRLGDSRFRYIGVVEIEGTATGMADRGPARRRAIRQPMGMKQQLFISGAVIRKEPRTFGEELAVLHHSIAIDVMKQLDDKWFEVAYRDTDVYVRGFISRRAPPGRTHRRPSEDPMPPVETNATVAANTCLFVDGDPVGFVDSELPVLLSPSRAGWFTLTVDTPWGHTAFEAKGPIETQLVTCP